ncbi:cell division protein [Streptomyces sp. SID12501]|uniref:Cell division protein n=1 Tax=Streptomyces sp. SID12501 TaxID=2706042 RepID=A0A6B3BQH3_9ACTN|nr:cell division protein [Streptomyces sp. SID12501]NEC86616.1 cell division protein [Streptomyces sp. SID12501]
MRQRCGFGCVVCGLPLYEYEHMIEWSKTKRHVADEITLLCNLHHAEKTRGFLSVADVMQANLNPKNLQSVGSAPYSLRFSGDTCLVDMGGNQALHYFSHSPVANALMIDGFPVIKFEQSDGHLLLSLRIYGRNGRRLLEIYENELVYSVDSWDIELVGTALTIRGGARKILAEIKFDPSRGVTIRRGLFARGDHVIRVEPDYLMDEKKDIRLSGSYVEGCPGWAFAF